MSNCHCYSFLAAFLIILGLVRGSQAADYYVRPSGSDASDGLTTNTAWRSVAKVNSFAFVAGDRVLFQRGGEWREALRPNASGAAGNPIVFEAYGTGAKPKFWGSIVLTNANFASGGGNTYTYSIPNLPGGEIFVLQDHVFLGNGPAGYSSPTLTITSPTDPRTDGKLYTVCVLGNVIFNNFKDHLVFRNLVADETAGENAEGNTQGYGIRIQSSTDVVVEDCEAYRCGRHNVGVINATGFVGRRLLAAYAAPKIAGGNSIYVSYADGGAPVAKCEHQWVDCVSTHSDNGSGGTYPAFDCHGSNQGRLTIVNFKADSKFTLQVGPATVNGGEISAAGSLENYGDGVIIDGLNLLGSAVIDQYGDSGIIQNCVANLNPVGAGPTGYSTAILCRDGATNNVIRFNTLVTKNFTGLVIKPKGSRTQMYGNLFASNGRVFALWDGASIDATDLAYANYNFFNANPTFQVSFSDRTFAAWQGFGFDTNSLAGDPLFVSAVSSNFHLQAGSTAINAAAVGAGRTPVTDSDGIPRPNGPAPDMGAFEYYSGPPPAPVITSSTNAAATITLPFSYQITATANPTNYSATGLPPGIDINPGTGLLSGIPAQAGFFLVVIGATGATGTGTANLALTVALEQVPPGSIYVDVNWTNHPGAGTANNPFDNLGSAVTAANASNDTTIAVADGLYKSLANGGRENFGAQGLVVTKSISLRGGYPGWTGAGTFDWANRAPRTADINLTSAATRAFYIATASILVNFDGFTIRNGIAASGGAIYVGYDFGTSLQLNNCVFSNNTATTGDGGAVHGRSNSTQGYAKNCEFTENHAPDTTATADGRQGRDGRGGALFMDIQFASSALITNCFFRGNTCGRYGGALAVDMHDGSVCSLSVIGCTFAGNHSAGDGGAINSADGTSSSLVIRESTFSGNASAGDGAAVGGGEFWQGEYALQNCLIVSNTGSYAVMNDAWRLDGYALDVAYCTIADNPNGGVRCVPHGAGLGLRVRDSIVVNNGPMGISHVNSPGATLTYNDVFGHTANYAGDAVAGAGSIVTDPIFFNATAGDYHLAVGSPAADVGLDIGISADIERAVRPQGGGFDMGAFETPGAPVTTSTTTTTSTSTSTETSTLGATSTSSSTTSSSTTTSSTTSSTTTSTTSSTSTTGGTASNPDWRYKMRIDYSGYRKSETLSNFPALVRLGSSVSTSFTYSVLADPVSGGDLRFMDAGEQTNLNHEIELWNTNGESCVWVQVPQLTSNAYVWAYFGNPAQTAPPPSRTNGATWTQGFVGVWHMNQSPTNGAIFPDSVSNNLGRFIDTAGTHSAAVSGVVGGAVDFAGVDDYLRITNKAAFNQTNAITISAWVKGWPAQGNPWLARFGNNNEGWQFGRATFGGPSAIAWTTFPFGGITDTHSPDIDNNWTFVAATLGGGRQVVYVNGVENASKVESGSLGNTSASLAIGTRIDGTDNPQNAFYDGLIDEVRISRVSNSSNWIWACYLNAWSNSLFSTYGDVLEIHKTPPSGAVIWVR